MEEYPRSVTIGDEARIVLGIDNRENATTTFDVEVAIDGQSQQSVGPFILRNQESKTTEITLKPFRVGDNQQVDFLLHKNGNPVPYLRLHIWLDVHE
jgi:uncharacterized membrane protein